MTEQVNHHNRPPTTLPQSKRWATGSTVRFEHPSPACKSATQYQLMTSSVLYQYQAQTIMSMILFLSHVLRKRFFQYALFYSWVKGNAQMRFCILIIELKAAIREFETDFVTKHGHKVRTCITNKTKFTITIMCKRWFCAGVRLDSYWNSMSFNASCFSCVWRAWMNTFRNCTKLWISKDSVNSLQMQYTIVTSYYVTYTSINLAISWGEVASQATNWGALKTEKEF